MKYIRTKDGIYKGNEDWYRQCYCFEPIIKQADTIEELCDEICLTNGNDIPLVIHNVVELDNTLFKSAYSLRNQYKNIYGAIWTDKGLIYVAKMNDKGELELYYD